MSDPRQPYRVRDWWAIDGDHTLRLEYVLGEDSIVVDLGGYKGDFAEAIHRRYGSTIHIFEPAPAFIERLRQRFAGNPKIHVHGYALGGRDSTLTFWLQEDATSSFSTGAGEQITASVRCISSVLRELAVDTIALIKMNVEGAEYELVEELVESGWIRRIDNLQVQFHNFGPGDADRMRALRDRLAATHFPTYLFGFVWENWRRRDFVSPESASRELSRAMDVSWRTLDVLRERLIDGELATEALREEVRKEVREEVRVLRSRLVDQDSAILALQAATEHLWRLNRLVARFKKFLRRRHHAPTTDS